MKPDPMPVADGRDAHPYLARMAFAGGLGLTVSGLRRRTSRDAGPYLARMAFASGLGLAVGGLMRPTSGDAGPDL
jgi:hypothetical protein